MSPSTKTVVVERPDQLFNLETRRGFLKMLGVGGTIVLVPSLFEACKSDKVTGVNGAAMLDLTTDTGILNYAYALEQLEAAFYTAVVASGPYGGMNAEQKEVFADLRNHEVIHREFLKAALGSSAIGALSLNATAVASTLTDTNTILKNSEAFEDLGVSAYNGAGKYLASAAYLLLAGKIVSVEARHAAAIRDMRDALGVTGTDTAGTRFAGDSVVIATGTYQGLDVKLEPSAVLTRVAATTLVSTNITTTGPTTKSGTPDNGPPPTP